MRVVVLVANGNEVMMHFQLHQCLPVCEWVVADTYPFQQVEVALPELLDVPDLVEAYVDSGKLRLIPSMDGNSKVLSPSIDSMLFLYTKIHFSSGNWIVDISFRIFLALLLPSSISIYILISGWHGNSRWHGRCFGTPSAPNFHHLLPRNSTDLDSLLEEVVPSLLIDFEPFLQVEHKSFIILSITVACSS